MHDQSKITRRRALQMAGAVAGLAAGSARAGRIPIAHRVMIARAPDGN